MASSRDGMIQSGGIVAVTRSIENCPRLPSCKSSNRQGVTAAAPCSCEPCWCLLQAARDYGFVGPVTQPAKLSRSFSLFKWELVDWSAIPAVVPVWIGMVFVVAFSSSLDVAAIEIGEA